MSDGSHFRQPWPIGSHAAEGGEVRVPRFGLDRAAGGAHRAFDPKPFVALTACVLLAGILASLSTISCRGALNNVAVEMALSTTPSPDVRIISDASPNPLTDPMAIKQASAVKEAVEPLIAGYEGLVSLTYQPVGLPAGSYSVDGDKERLSASMIKMLVLACLLDRASDGLLDMQKRLTVAEDDIVSGSGVIQGQGPGGVYTVDELAFLMIAASDNTATNMLIDLVGMDSINASARTFGLTHTKLVSKMMSVVDEDAERNHTSSEDLARLFDLIATGELVDEASSETALRYLGRQTIDAGLESGLPQGFGVAHKTGSLDGVSNDGGIVYAPHPYVLVVLVEGVDNGEAELLIENISNAVFVANERGATRG